MTKIERLVEAMKQQEGWHAANPESGYIGSASWRRHNPLNLRKSQLAVAYENGFCIFLNDAVGTSAAEIDIFCKAIGHTSTGLTGDSTLSDLIHVWAPVSDHNDPDSYLLNVLQSTGFTATMPLKQLLVS